MCGEPSLGSGLVLGESALRVLLLKMDALCVDTCTTRGEGAPLRRVGDAFGEYWFVPRIDGS